MPSTCRYVSVALKLPYLTDFALKNIFLVSTTKVNGKNIYYIEWFGSSC